MKKRKNQALVRILIILFFTIVCISCVLRKQLSYASWIEEGNRIKYQQEDGQYATGFVDIEFQRYYFDAEGYLAKGKFYVAEENAYYYANESGAVQSGVIETGDNFYVTDDGGRLKTGFVDKGNQRYYFNDSVDLVKGWFKVDSNWYYADDSGAVMTGFVTLDGYRYYLDSDGVRVSDAVLEIDGITYVFNKDGSIDENATNLYPVFAYLNKVRNENDLTNLLLNSRVQACAFLRASELEDGFQKTSNNYLEQMLSNRGVLCEGGCELSYGGIAEYGIEQLINDMKQDAKLQSVLKDDTISEVGIGSYSKDGKSYYDIIFLR